MMLVWWILVIKAWLTISFCWTHLKKSLVVEIDFLLLFRFLWWKTLHQNVVAFQILENLLHINLSVLRVVVILLNEKFFLAGADPWVRFCGLKWTELIAFRYWQSVLNFVHIALLTIKVATRRRVIWYDTWLSGFGNRHWDSSAAMILFTRVLNVNHHL